jgi:undecaprenyl-diphosphatase
VTVFQALILGIVQGLAEFLPISSSAHLALAPWILHWDDPGLAFDVALHFGTLVAVLWYFRAEWIALAVAAKDILVKRRIETDRERRVMFLIVATIPGAIAGLAFEKQAESTFRDPRLVATALIVMGILLWAVDRFASRERTLATMRSDVRDHPWGLTLRVDDHCRARASPHARGRGGFQFSHEHADHCRGGGAQDAASNS